MNEQLQRRLEKQHYAIVGQHTGVKLCHWMKQSLLHQRHCYKQDFYGIESHRCLQMTPTINQCNHGCLFCWRYQGFSERELTSADPPQLILDQSIQAQQRLISGFKGDDRCDPRKWEEAHKPTMIACSLSGEPTLYPYLGRFFETCHDHEMTTFLVSNGTTPEVLSQLDSLPTQLYISLVAPNKDVYKKLCNPVIEDGWERIHKTLEILSSLKTRTVVRHTLVKGWNMDESYIKSYADLIMKAQPDFIEPKGYVFVGSSRKRMTIEAMPTHDEIIHFSRLLAERTGYNIVKEKPDSRVVLLSSGRVKENIREV
jgi:tRNA wybutosine-synthesizing protein 1